jgi:hypothetical protein
MKKSGLWLVSLVLVSILVLSSVNFISASWFSDFLGKITGNVVSTGDISTGLVGYWPLDGNADDSSGNGKNGVANNILFDSGKFGQAATFFGNDNYISISDSGAYAFIDDFSISLWMKSSDKKAEFSGLLTRYDTGKGWDFIYRGDVMSGSVRFGVRGSSSVDTGSIANGLSDGNWHNLIVTVDRLDPSGNTVVNTYADNKLVSTVSGVWNSISSVSGLLIGDRSDGIKSLNGSIDDVRIYNRVLSVNDIQTLYNSVPSSTSNSSVPVATCTQNSDCGITNIQKVCNSYQQSCDYITYYHCMINKCANSTTTANCTTCPNGCASGACVNSNSSTTTLSACPSKIKAAGWWFESENFSVNNIVRLKLTFLNNNSYGKSFNFSGDLSSFQLWTVPSVINGIPVKINSAPLGIVPYGSSFSYDLEIDLRNISSKMTNGSVQQTGIAFRPSDNGLFGAIHPMYIPILSYSFDCFSVQNVTCTDSDGGLNYYVVGAAQGNFNGIGTTSDVCLNSNILDEAYCINSTDYRMASYTCLNGCSNGACNAPSASCAENYKLYAKVLTANTISLYQIPNNNYSVVQCNNLAIGGTCYVGNLEIEVLSINENTEDMVLSVKSPGKFDFIYKDDKSYDLINSNQMAYNEGDRYFVVSYCGQTTQVCQSLIDNPIIYNDFGSYNLTRSSTQHTNYSEFGDANITELYYTKQNSNDRLFVGIVVLDDKTASIANSKWLSQIKQQNNWNGEKQYVSNPDGSSYMVDIYTLAGIDGKANFWYNNNVLIYLVVDSFNSGSQINLNNFLSSIQDNQFKNVYNVVPYSNDLAMLTSSYLNQCTSTAVEPCWPFWESKIEPVICPPHGYQNDIQIDRNNCFSKKESQRYCSPGICSGCMVPRYSGNDNGENVCIPYGTRLAFSPSQEIKVYMDSLNQDIASEGFSLVVNPDNSLTISIINSSYGQSYTIVANGVTYGQVGDSKTVYAGDSYNVIISDNFGNNDTFDVQITDIFYSTTSSQQYVKFKLLDNYDGYCDVSGHINQQKTQAWEKCDNNYECASNLCSYSQCADIKGMFDQVNKFKLIFVRSICKISHLFNIEDYNQCVVNYAL